MKKTSKTLAWAAGTTLISGLVTVAVGAEANFQINELSSGYMQLAAADAAAAPKSSDATKATEGKCAGAQPITTTPKATEGKCGEGKCGGTMKPAEPAKAAPSIDGKAATDAKATEGKCGEGKCGGAMLKGDSHKAAETKPAEPAKTEKK